MRCNCGKSRLSESQEETDNQPNLQIAFDMAFPLKCLTDAEDSRPHHHVPFPHLVSRSLHSLFCAGHHFPYHTN